MEKTNEEIAAFLRRAATLLELAGENPFKTRSYRGAADTVEESRETLSEVVAAGGQAALQALGGVGKSLSAQIAEFVATGSSEQFEALRAETPESVADLLLVRGIGPKTAATLYREFGVLDLDDLRSFAAGGGLDVVSGLPEKTAARLVRSIDELAAARPALPRSEASALAESIASEVEVALAATGGFGGGNAPQAAAPRGAGSRPGGSKDARAGASSVRAVGALRRERERVNEIELLAITRLEASAGGEAAAAAADAAARIAALPSLGSVRVVRPDRVEATLADGIRVTVFIADASVEPSALVRTTGSRRHVRELEELARRESLEFRGYALYAANEPAKTRMPMMLDDEEDFYARLGLAFIAPPAREGAGEIDDALRTA